MDRLSSCYFCGDALDASLDEYPVVPPALRPSGGAQKTVVLCRGCHRKLDTVLDLVVESVEDRLDGDQPGIAESLADADDVLRPVEEGSEPGSADDLETGPADGDERANRSGSGADRGRSDDDPSSGDSPVEGDTADDSGIAVRTDERDDSSTGRSNDSAEAAPGDPLKSSGTGDPLKSSGDETTDDSPGISAADRSRDGDASASERSDAGDARTGRSEDGAAAKSDRSYSSSQAAGGRPVGEGSDQSRDAEQAGSESGSTESSEAGADEGRDSDGPSLTRLEYNKVMRLLKNREFPVDRAEFVTVASNAYQFSESEVDQVLDAAIDHGLLDERDGQLVSGDD